MPYVPRLYKESLDTEDEDAAPLEAASKQRSDDRD
jgi:hypothetical protein